MFISDHMPCCIVNLKYRENYSILPGQCQVNLDAVSGKYPPLLLQNSDFIFPTSEIDEKRLLSFGEGDNLQLFCHGSER